MDEIGEISASFQAKLLRVLQEGEFERVGGIRTLKVNVRIIAATNRNLEQEVAEGHFREDLYYRLNVMPINMPPLRDRIEDIPELASFLLNRISKQQGGRHLEVKESALRILMKHDWPGNVRELENRLERERVIAALEQSGWVQAKAARLLDMTPRQIAYRIQTLNINVKQI